MDKIVGVIAGTPVDTRMGVEFLSNNKIKSLGYPISKNAKEQSILQLLSKKTLYKKVRSTILEAKKNGVRIFFVYCNSLSAAVDMEKISKETNTHIVTPFSAYTDFGANYSSLLVLAANGQSCGRIEAILEESNDNIKIWSLSALPLVESIEEEKLSSEIFRELNLEYILSWAELIKVEGIILGCTHFPYMIDMFRTQTNISILDPAERMLGKLLEIHKIII